MNKLENLKDLMIYQSKNNENISVEVLYDNEDFWLTQKSMSQLFNVEVNTINYHLKEIFNNKELEEKRTIRKIRTVQKEENRDVSRKLTFYSLDSIIAVGYRVNSKEATDFRIWATQTLKEYIKKGFVLNDELLKNGPKFGQDYFKELLERIRSIRTSERRIWQQIMIAKNYLEERQIKRLERTVSGYFDYIEDLVERENTFTMDEFAKSVNEFLEFRKYEVLKENGKNSKKMAEEKAELEYNKFNKNQKINSDFDKLLIEAKKIKK